MPAFLLIILPFIKKFWIPILIIGVLLTYTVYVYKAGKDACKADINQTIIEEQLKRQVEIDNLNLKVNQLKDKLSLKPQLTDGENSCILSNNPIRVECL